MRAPNSLSFLSKAYNFLKGRTSANDENFYSKSKKSFPNEFCPILGEPMNHKAFPCISRKNRQVLGEISNRPRSVTNQLERKPQRKNLESFSPRSLLKNYWPVKADEKLNNGAGQAPNSKTFCEQTEDDEQEGIFTIQLIKPQNGFLGIVLVGGANTPLENHYVNDVLPNSSASKSGRVRTGDELLKANGQTLTGKTHAEALSIFKSLPAVVELMVARTKDANRTILERLSYEKKSNKKVNKNIASPDRRSVIEEAAKTSVVPRSLSSVIHVTKKEACPHVRRVKRISRVSSFAGKEGDKMPTNNASDRNGEAQKEKPEATNEVGDDNIKEIEKTCIPSSSIETKDFAVHPGGGIPIWSKTSDPLTTIFDPPKNHRDDTPRYSTMRRSQTLNAHKKGQSTVEGSDARATWPAFTTKQRLPLPWDLLQPSRTATIGRRSSSSSARIRRSIAATSASNPSLHQGSSARKPTRGHYIEKKTITVELQRASACADWGFTLGGGICSPYGDLPIFIAEISPSNGTRGLLQKGDEIVEFSGESFQGATCLEAERMVKRYEKEKVTVTIKRKFLQRNQRPQGNPYAEAWTSLATTKTKPACKQRKHAKTMHC